MPLNAYGVLATFMAAGTVIGSAIGWLVGPRRWAVAILPVLAAIASLGTLGHRLRIGFGPTVPLFGFEVHLFSDLGFAALFALLAAVVQRGAIGALHRPGPASRGG
ncbi:MAG TPA: hypothetical protein VNE21_02095 [Mycobacteriales bacterium]|nr:hypothetical protein [Mycobacteriales bacterium]